MMSAGDQQPDAPRAVPGGGAASAGRARNRPDENGGAGVRRLILIDVDGVLNPDFSATIRRRLTWHGGWVQRHVDVGGLDFRVMLNPQHGRWLRDLAADTGAELAWGTTWEDDANRSIGPLIGLPRLPVAPVRNLANKAASIVPWTAGRPFVWFDDAPGAPGAAAELAGTQPHLVIPVDEKAGLSEQHIARARAWLGSLADG